MSAILLLTNAFRVFDLIAALTDGGPGYSSQVLTTLIYKNAFYYGEYGYADAIGVMTVIFSIIAVSYTHLQQRRQKDYGGHQHH